MKISFSWNLSVFMFSQHLEAIQIDVRTYREIHNHMALEMAEVNITLIHFSL